LTVPTHPESAPRAAAGPADAGLLREYVADRWARRRAAHASAPYLTPEEARNLKEAACLLDRLAELLPSLLAALDRQPRRADALRRLFGWSFAELLAEQLPDALHVLGVRGGPAR
jgi:hypothetical protein